MTFDEYIQNPMGKTNSVISNRIMYRNMYQEKLDKIMVREAGKVDYKAYKDNKRYILYIKIPSEIVPEFYYDVLIEFTEPKDANVLGSDLSKYEVRFYSNDPSFVFTFAHAFKTNKMFFMDFDDKMSKKALKELADEKNPQDVVGYVKSLFFAYLIMKKRGLFFKALYVDKYNAATLHKEIMHADKKIEARQNAAKELSVEKKKEKQKQKDMTSKRNNQNPETPLGHISKAIKNTPIVKSMGKMKTIKNIKTIKKVGKK